VGLGEADAAVVYISDVTPELAPDVATIAVPDRFNQIARYPIAPLLDAAQPEIARQFVAYVLAKDGGQEILSKWNFIPASPEMVATNEVTVKDAAGNTTTLTLADLQALPETEVSEYALVGSSRGPLGTFSWTGASLEDVLKQADPHISASTVMSVTIVAGDGFRTQVGAAEIFETPEGKPTILAYKQGGEPMNAIQGAIRLIISGYEFADRQVKWVKEIEIIPAE
jgi:DMSO/TMAO reductase YedYZ molybdopterin-dependent catalytic subunit